MVERRPSIYRSSNGLADDQRMVVYVNKLTLTGPADDLERIYRTVADFFGTQPGLIRFQLVRSTRQPEVYINIAEWRDEDSFRRAVAELRARGLARVRSVADGDSHLCTVVSRGGAV